MVLKGVDGIAQLLNIVSKVGGIELTAVVGFLYIFVQEDDSLLDELFLAEDGLIVGGCGIFRLNSCDSGVELLLKAVNPAQNLGEVGGILGLDGQFNVAQSNRCIISGSRSLRQLNGSRTSSK